MMSAPGRRRQVAFAHGRGLSTRRACALFDAARSGLRYVARRAIADAPVVGRMRELARSTRATATGGSGSLPRA
jgi:putative transposase